ncbi:MAG TPA: c-type cytochrome [Paracoccaceae bacterium]|mgnify:CR=1 FL=1|nr:c-type cytochrome [Paracoccaceae bacterium]HMO70458.1 c-type cytochrome [Paracoccaceae bacterium]
MFDTMTMTKTVGALCGALLVFLLGKWAAELIYHPHGGGHGEVTQAYVIDTGEAPVDEGPVMSFEEMLAAADAGAGERVFGKCRACHKVDGTDGTGPHLNGIVGKAKASSSGFAYSPALAAMSAETWTPESLDAFLANPRGYAPNNRMSFAGLPSATERVNLIAWLATQP